MIALSAAVVIFPATAAKGSVKPEGTHRAVIQARLFASVAHVNGAQYRAQLAPRPYVPRHARSRPRPAPRPEVQAASASAPPVQPPPPPPPPPAVPAGALQQWALAQVGSVQFACLLPLWNQESGWNPSAENPSSGAYGIPQALPGYKMASAGADWQTNPYTQMRWGLSYIDGSYGSPCGAWGHEQADGWY